MTVAPSMTILLTVGLPHPIARRLRMARLHQIFRLRPISRLRPT
jgi:hypothetical protein